MFEDFDEMAEEGRALTRFGLMQKLQNELESVERQLEEINSPKARRRVKKSASSVTLQGGRKDEIKSRGERRTLGHSTSLPAGVRVSKPSRKRKELQRAQKLGASLHKKKGKGGNRARSAPRHRAQAFPETVTSSTTIEERKRSPKENGMTRPKSSPVKSRLGYVLVPEVVIAARCLETHLSTRDFLLSSE